MINQNLFGLDNSLQIPSIPYMGNKRKLATRIINSIIDMKGQSFSHFYDWCMNIDSPVFVSEYYMPKDFKLINSFEHKSTLSATNNDKKVIENLYWNGK